MAYSANARAAAATTAATDPKFCTAAFVVCMGGILLVVEPEPEPEPEPVVVPFMLWLRP